MLRGTFFSESQFSLKVLLPSSVNWRERSVLIQFFRSHKHRHRNSNHCVGHHQKVMSYFIYFLQMSEKISCHHPRPFVLLMYPLTSFPIVIKNMSAIFIIAVYPLDTFITVNNLLAISFNFQFTIKHHNGLFPFHLRLSSSSIPLPSNDFLFISSHEQQSNGYHH